MYKKDKKRSLYSYSIIYYAVWFMNSFFYIYWLPKEAIAFYFKSILSKILFLFFLFFFSKCMEKCWHFCLLEYFHKWQPRKKT